MTRPTFLAFAVSVLAALPAAAQQSDPDAVLPEVEAGAGAFAAADADGDGVIDAAEWEALIGRLPDRLARGLERAAVDPAERRAAVAEAIVARLDTDGDGLLDAAEIAAGMEAQAERRAERRERMQPARADTGWRERGPRLGAGPGRRSDAGPPWLDFDALDTDGDGAISRAEFAAAREAWAARIGAPLRPRRD